MSAKQNILTYGEMKDVFYFLDEGDLNLNEVCSLLQNICSRIDRIERTIEQLKEQQKSS